MGAYVLDVLKALHTIVLYEGGSSSDDDNFAWAMFDATPSTYVQQRNYGGAYKPIDARPASCVTLFMDGVCITEDVIIFDNTNELRLTGPPRLYKRFDELEWASSPFWQQPLEQVQIYLPERCSEYMEDIGHFLMRHLPRETHVWLNGAKFASS